MDLRRSRLGAAVRSAATENVGLKATALFIAIALFSLVRGAGDVQRSIDVPLTVNVPLSLAGNPVLLTALPDKVRVTIRGSSSVVGSLRADELGALQLDLRDGHRTSVRLDPTLVHLPAGASFVSFTPDVLELHWDVLIARALPIRASVVGNPAARMRVDPHTIEVEPERVRVMGPSLYVDPLAAVHTDPLDVTGLPQGQYERRIPLESPRAELAYEDVSTGARVTFTIVPTVTERRIEDLPVTLMGSLHAVLRPSLVDVVVRGDPVEVERLHPSQVVVVAELPDPAALAHGPVAARVSVRPLPAGCEATQVSPNEVLVVPVR